MKFSVLSTLALMLISAVGFAQGGPEGRPESRQEKKEEIEARRTAFITKELQLNATESKNFWAVVNEHDAKRKERAEAIKGNSERTPGGKNLNELTDEQIAKNMAQRFEMKKAMLDLEIEYHEKYVGVIGVRKTAEYYRAEEKFKRELLKRMRDKRGAGGKGGNRPSR